MFIYSFNYLCTNYVFGQNEHPAVLNIWESSKWQDFLTVKFPMPVYSTTTKEFLDRASPMRTKFAVICSKLATDCASDSFWHNLAFKY